LNQFDFSILPALLPIGDFERRLFETENMQKRKVSPAKAEAMQKAESKRIRLYNFRRVDKKAFCERVHTLALKTKGITSTSTGKSYINVSNMDVSGVLEDYSVTIQNIDFTCKDSEPLTLLIEYFGSDLAKKFKPTNTFDV
jgi:hypothetical protein